jgi:hypothetical protein
LSSSFFGRVFGVSSSWDAEESGGVACCTKGGDEDGGWGSIIETSS